MKFLRALDRTLVHLYCITALTLAFSFLSDNIAYHQAAFVLGKAQAGALTVIAIELQAATGT